MRMCNIPRGGHVHVHTENVEKIVEAVTWAPAPYGIPLNGWKVIFQAFLTAVNVFCWLVPLKSKKMSENKLALSLANAFSGGVFLTLAFGHLIPECIHGFDGYNEVTPFMLVLAGYLLIFFVEKVAFDTHDLLHVMEHDHGEDHTKAGTNGHVHSTAGSGRSAIILLGALGIHSILEMMALGLADSFGDCALLTLSIALHQVREMNYCRHVSICDFFNSIFTAYCTVAGRIDCFAGGFSKVGHAKESNSSILINL
jgi:ZIP Zinc transporter